MSQVEEHLLTLVYADEHLPPKYGEEVFAYTAMHKRERELVYGALFVCGRYNGKKHRAPLCLFRAHVKDDAYHALRVETKGVRLNRVALDILGGDKALEMALRETFVGDGLSESTVAEIDRLIGQFCPDVERQSLQMWPHLEPSGKVNDAGGEEKVSILSAAGVGNVERSVSTRGVIQELRELCQLPQSQWSAPLQKLMGLKDRQARSSSACSLFVPTSLSQQQEKVLQSARSAPLTVCHGPPGTGKSFTVAAIALDHAVRGESVLVTSRGDHAVNVMHEKIDGLIGAEHATVRAGRKSHLRELKWFLQLLLSGGSDYIINHTVSLEVLRQRIQKKIELIEDAEDVLEQEFAKSIDRVDAHLTSSPNILQKLQKVWSSYAINRRPLLAEMHYHYSQLQHERESMVSQYIELQRKCTVTAILDCKESRMELKCFFEALRKRNGSKQEEAMKRVDFDVLLKALPVWLACVEDVHRVLPNTTELFDLVIIDEASMCDIASMLPVIQRAKRVVVVGDTKQLRHISFLSNHMLQQAAEEYQLGSEVVGKFNFRTTSLMDLAVQSVDDQSNTGYLDEHYRSYRSIIDFSNREMYQGRLKLMRDRPWKTTCDSFGHCGLVGHFVVGGMRDAHGVNQAEIDAIIAWLLKFSKSPQSQKPFTIGVLSPFRAQVDALTKQIFEAFRGYKLQRFLSENKLLIGTAHSFQGEERDVMLLSMGVCATSSHGTLRFLERQDVFNVSITRARNEQHIFHSVRLSDLKAHSLLWKYLTYIDALDQRRITPSTQRDLFAEEVVDALSKLGAQCNASVEVADISIDIVVHTTGGAFGIDLVGYPGAMQAAVEARRTLMLHRAGLEVIPLGYLEWQLRKDECIAFLKKKCVIA